MKSTYIPFALVDLKDGTVTVNSGSSSLSINVGEGDMRFTEAREIEYRRNRGALSEVKEGDEVPVELTLDLEWTYLDGSSGSETPESIITGRDGQTSSDSDTCAPYAVDIVVELDPSTVKAACTGYKKLTFTDFRYESMDYSLSDARISVTGKCNITQVTVDNTK